MIGTRDDCRLHIASPLPDMVAMNQSPRHASLLAVVYAATAAAMTAVDVMIVRMLGGDVHPFVMAFFRGFFGLVAILPWIVWRPSRLTTRFRLMHVLRACVKILSIACAFTAFTIAPLADVMAILFTAPVFVTIGAWLLLGERVTLVRAASVVSCFIGAIIIIGPSGGGETMFALLMAVLAAALLAVMQLMLKHMSSSDPADTLVAWNLILTVPLAAVPAWFFWTTPSRENLILLTLQGILGAANMSLMTKAFSLAPASHVATVDFLRLPFVAFVAFMVFGEVARHNTWIGAALIVGALTAPLLMRKSKVTV